MSSSNLHKVPIRARREDPSPGPDPARIKNRSPLPSTPGSGADPLTSDYSVVDCGNIVVYRYPALSNPEAPGLNTSAGSMNEWGPGRALSPDQLSTGSASSKSSGRTNGLVEGSSRPVEGSSKALQYKQAVKRGHDARQTRSEDQSLGGDRYQGLRGHQSAEGLEGLRGHQSSERPEGVELWPVDAGLYRQAAVRGSSVEASDDTDGKKKNKKKKKKRREDNRGMKKRSFVENGVTGGREVSPQIRMILQELFETEWSYMSDLFDVIKGYMKPICETTNIRMRPEDFNLIFFNIRDIYKFTRYLMIRLKKVGLDDWAVTEIFIEEVKEFEVYTGYCRNYQRALMTLQKVQQDPLNAGFLRRCQTDIGHMLPLETYLFKPVQRILKYHLILKSLLQQYPADSEGYTRANHALELMVGVAEHINEMKRRDEMTFRRSELQKRFFNDLIDLTQYGDLLLEDKFTMAGVREQRTVLLFRKAVLICKERREGSYQLKVTLMCGSLILNDVVRRDPYSFYLSAYQSPKTQYTLQAKTLDQKTTWCKQIKKLIMESFSVPLPDNKLLAYEEQRKKNPFATVPVKSAARASKPTAASVFYDGNSSGGGGPGGPAGSGGTNGFQQERRRARRTSAGPATNIRSKSPDLSDDDYKMSSSNRSGRSVTREAAAVGSAMQQLLRSLPMSRLLDRGDRRSQSLESLRRSLEAEGLNNSSSSQSESESSVKGGEGGSLATGEGGGLVTGEVQGVETCAGETTKPDYYTKTKSSEAYVDKAMAGLPGEMYQEEFNSQPPLILSPVEGTQHSIIHNGDLSTVTVHENSGLDLSDLIESSDKRLSLGSDINGLNTDNIDINSSEGLSLDSVERVISNLEESLAVELLLPHNSSSPGVDEEKFQSFTGNLRQMLRSFDSIESLGDLSALTLDDDDDDLTNDELEMSADDLGEGEGLEEGMKGLGEREGLNEDEKYLREEVDGNCSDMSLISIRESSEQYGVTSCDHNGVTADVNVSAGSIEEAISLSPYSDHVNMVNEKSADIVKEEYQTPGYADVPRDVELRQRSKDDGVSSGRDIRTCKDDATSATARVDSKISTTVTHSSKLTDTVTNRYSYTKQTSTLSKSASTRQEGISPNTRQRIKNLSVWLTPLTNSGKIESKLQAGRRALSAEFSDEVWLERSLTRNISLSVGGEAGRGARRIETLAEELCDRRNQEQGVVPVSKERLFRTDVIKSSESRSKAANEATRSASFTQLHKQSSVQHPGDVSNITVSRELNNVLDVIRQSSRDLIPELEEVRTESRALLNEIKSGYIRTNSTETGCHNGLNASGPVTFKSSSSDTKLYHTEVLRKVEVSSRSNHSINSAEGGQCTKNSSKSGSKINPTYQTQSSRRTTSYKTKLKQPGRETESNSTSKFHSDSFDRNELPSSFLVCDENVSGAHDEPSEELDVFDASQRFEPTADRTKPTYVSRMARAYSNRVKKEKAELHRNHRVNPVSRTTYRPKMKTDCSLSLSRSRSNPYRSSARPRERSGSLGDRSEARTRASLTPESPGSRLSLADNPSGYSVKETLSLFERRLAEIQHSNAQSRKFDENRRKSWNKSLSEDWSSSSTPSPLRPGAVYIPTLRDSTTPSSQGSTTPSSQGSGSSSSRRVKVKDSHSGSSEGTIRKTKSKTTDTPPNNLVKKRLEQLEQFR